MRRSRFFCENCHHEVKPNAKVCPHCGRFFTAVRCPVCSYVGHAGEFSAGCPNCGYSAGSNSGRGIEIESYDPAEPPVSRRTASTSQRPVWVFPLALAILAAVFVGLAILYINMAG